jgi:hypothetical protein
VTVSIHPTSMTVLVRDCTYALDSRVAIVKVRAGVDVLRAVRMRFARREVGYTESGSSGAVWPASSSLLAVEARSSGSCVAMAQYVHHMQQRSLSFPLQPAAEMLWDEPLRGWVQLAAVPWRVQDFLWMITSAGSGIMLLRPPPRARTTALSPAPCHTFTHRVSPQWS